MLVKLARPTVYEHIKFFRKFNEGSELGEAVEALLDAAKVLNSIACDLETELALLAAHNLIIDYMKRARSKDLDWDEYEQIDPELYTFILGGARKLTMEEYDND